MLSYEAAGLAATILAYAEGNSDYKKLTTDERLLVLKTSASVLERQIEISAMLQCMRDTLGSTRER